MASEFDEKGKGRLVLLSKTCFDNYYKATATRKKLKKSEKKFSLPSSFYPFEVAF